MTAPHDTVFLLDVDNTLLDNDRIIADLRAHLEREFGAACAGHYWAHFEALRSDLGYADYLGALQRYRRYRPCHSLRLTVETLLAMQLEPVALTLLRLLPRFTILR